MQASKLIRIVGGVGLGLVMFAAGSAAYAMVAGAGTAATAQAQQTPRQWNWEIRDGKRVPKSPGNRVTNPDGSWRETVREGNCTVTKEMTATGEYKEVRGCN